MARIRTIKPEFPHSESVGRLTRDARLLFIQLWTLCDDSGKARAASRVLASLLYPYDDDAANLIDGWLEELERERCIDRYVVDGATYLQVVKWSVHQKIDRPSQSKLPDSPKPRDASSSPREGASSPRRGIGSVSGPVKDLKSENGTANRPAEDPEKAQAARATAMQRLGEIVKPLAAAKATTP